MGQLLGFMILGWGAGTVFITVVMALGGIKIVISVVMPIMLLFVPQDEVMTAWLEVPMQMSLAGSLSNVGSMDEEGYLAAGNMDFFVQTAPDSWEDVEEPLTPVIYMQEDGAVDQQGRYVLQAGPLNYPSIFCWVLALGSLWVSGLAIVILLIKGKPSEVPEKETVGSATSLRM